MENLDNIKVEKDDEGVIESVYIKPEQVEYISQRFLKITYPLSEIGKLLKERIISQTISVEELSRELPTVENPRPELFADFDVSKEVANEVFGYELANIQVTKGCRHGCTFCAAGSSNRVQIMPFPAIVKVAEVKKACEVEMKEKFDEWLKDVQEATGVDIETLRNLQADINVPTISFEEGNTIKKRVAEIFFTHSFRQYWEKHNPTSAESFSYDLSLSKGKPTVMSFSSIPLGQFTSRSGNLYPIQITNYYDSDPFDYRDNNFLHSDGSPADFGDVARLLSSRERVIHITTAGWSRSDQIAQRAAEKVVALGRTLLSNSRLSVNQYEFRARKDKKKYLFDAINIINTFEPVGLKVIIFDDKSDPEYTEDVVNSIRGYIHHSGKFKKYYPVSDHLAKISMYSGRMAKGDGKDEDHDVMACMPGNHIWPNGMVAKQGNEKAEGEIEQVKKGTRPILTDIRLWKLEK